MFGFGPFVSSEAEAGEEEGLSSIEAPALTWDETLLEARLNPHHESLQTQAPGYIRVQGFGLKPRVAWMSLQAGATCFDEPERVWGWVGAPALSPHRGAALQGRNRDTIPLPRPGLLRKKSSGGSPPAGQWLPRNCRTTVLLWSVKSAS